MSWGCVGEECDLISEQGPGKCQCGADLVEQIKPSLRDIGLLCGEALRAYGDNAALAAAVAGELAVRQGDDLAACFEVALENAALYLSLAFAYQQRQREQTVAREMH